MRSFIYFLRQGDKSKMPRMTICLLYKLSEDCESVTVFARGIAICSLKETPIKEEGIRRAYERACEAFTEKKNSLSVNPDYKEVRKVLKTLYAEKDQAITGLKAYKSCYQPSITKYEDVLLHKLIEKEKNKNASK